MKRKLTLGVLWSFLSIMGTKVSTFIVTIVLARLLSPTDFGILAICLVFIEILRIFVVGGLAQVLVRLDHISEEDKTTAFISNLVLSLLLYVLVYFLAPEISRYYSNGDLELIIRVVALVLFPHAMNIVQSADLNHSMRFKEQSTIIIGSNVIAGLVGLVLAFLGYGVWALVLRYLLTTIIKTMLLWWYIPWIPRAGFSSSSFRRNFGMGYKFLVIDIIETIYRQFYSLAIGKVYSLDSLGLYSQGRQLVMNITDLASMSLKNATYSVYAKLKRDFDSLNILIEQVVISSSWLVFPILLYISFMSEKLVIFIFGHKWIEAAQLIPFISLMLCTRHLSVITINVLKVLGDTRTLIFYKLTSQTILLLCLFVSVRLEMREFLAVMGSFEVVVYIWGMFILRAKTDLHSWRILIHLTRIILFGLPSVFIGGVILNYVSALLPSIVLTVIFSLLMHYFVGYFVGDKYLRKFVNVLVNRIK